MSTMCASRRTAAGGDHRGRQRLTRLSGRRWKPDRQAVDGTAGRIDILEYASSPTGAISWRPAARGPPIRGMPKPGRWPGRCPRACRSVPANSRRRRRPATSDNDQIRAWNIGADTPPLVIGEIKEENLHEPHVYFLQDSKRLLTPTGTAWFGASTSRAHTDQYAVPGELVSSASFSPDCRWLVSTVLKSLGICRSGPDCWQ